MEDNKWNFDPEEDPFRDFIYEDQFTSWEETGEELFRCRLLITVESFVGIIDDYLKWCNQYVLNIKDLYLTNDGCHYFVNGKVVDDKGESIWKEFIDEQRNKGYETEDVIISYEIDSFGYLVIMPINYDFEYPVEVRIVNSNGRFRSFWGVLIRYIRHAFSLDQLKPETWQLGMDLPENMDLKVISGPLLGDQEITKKLTSGRKPNINYDKAWERIKNGMSTEKAYKLYLKEAKVSSYIRGTREAFDTAMRRRHKPTKYP